MTPITQCDYTAYGICVYDQDGSVFVFECDPVFGWRGKRTYYFDPTQIKRDDSLLIEGSLYED